MKIHTLSAGLLSIALLGSCDNGVISGPTTASIIARVTPWDPGYDSVIIDVRKGSFRGRLRTPSYKLMDRDESQYTIPDLPVGDWALVAVYFKTNWDTTVTPHAVKSTAHRAAVAQGSITVSYDANCSCNYVHGDDVDLRLVN